MTKSVWLAGFSGAVVVATAAFMPSKALATACCRSGWSNSARSGPQICQKTVGLVQGGVDYTNWVKGRVRIEPQTPQVPATGVVTVIAYNAYSPEVRLKIVCNDGFTDSTGFHYNDPNTGVAGAYSCSSGVVDAYCQVQFPYNDPLLCSLTCL